MMPLARFELAFGENFYFKLQFRLHRGSWDFLVAHEDPAFSLDVVVGVEYFLVC